VRYFLDYDRWMDFTTEGTEEIRVNTDVGFLLEAVTRLSGTRH